MSMRLDSRMPPGKVGPALLPGDGDVGLRAVGAGLDGNQIFVAAQDHPVKFEGEFVDVEARLGANFHSPSSLHAAKDAGNGAGRIGQALIANGLEKIAAVLHLLPLR